MKERLATYKIFRPYSQISNKDGYISGVYYCSSGVVECCSDIERNYSLLRFVYNGVLHTKTMEKSYSERGLAIMAGKFVKEILNNY